MNKEKKELQEEIRYLRNKRNCYYKLLRIGNSYEKRIVRRQIKELSTFINYKKLELRKLKTVNILNAIADQIERRISLDNLYI